MPSVPHGGDGSNIQGAIANYDDDGGYNSINPTLQQIIVQRNKIHDPRYSARDWTNGHPYGPQAVVLFNSGGNNVIRYNECYTTNGNFFNDVLGAGANGPDECPAGEEYCTGFPGPNSDIYCNYLKNCYDDCIEADGKGRNVRIWGNYGEYTLTHVSSAHITEGPMYIFREVQGWAGSGSYVGGECFLKCGEGNGEIYAYHNTMLQPSSHGPRGGFTDNGNLLTNMHARNNIIQMRTSSGHGYDDHKYDGNNHTFDVDYEFYNGQFLLNNVHVAAPANCILFVDPKFAAQTYNQGNNEGDFHLANDSGGYHTAEIVPNLNDMFVDPDMGAHDSEPGTPMLFGTLADWNDWI